MINVSRRHEITFYSDGLELHGTLFEPSVGQPSGGVVMCQGNMGVRSYGRFDEIAARLAGAELAALTFDYRGFGESEGARSRFVPLQLVADALCAVSALSARFGGFAGKIGIFGAGFGGAVAIMTGVRDPRIAVLVSLLGIADGARWLRRLRRYWEWQEFLRLIDVDRERRVRTGASEVVRMDEIIPPPPNAMKQRPIVQSMAVPTETRELTLEDAEAILNFRPQDVVGALSPRPLLIMHSEESDLVPLEEATALYRAAGNPKELVVFPRATHHDAFLDPLFDEVADRTVKWFRRWLDGSGHGSEPWRDPE